MNGLGFKPFDLVIPFAVRKGEITGKPLWGITLLYLLLHLNPRAVLGR